MWLARVEQDQDSGVVTVIGVVNDRIDNIAIGRQDLENKDAHTYVFDLWDGGRHHPYESLQQLEQGLEDDTVKEIQEWVEEEKQ